MPKEKPNPPDYVVFAPVYSEQKGFILKNDGKRIRIGTSRKIEHADGGIQIDLDATPMANSLQLWPYKERKT